MFGIEIVDIIKSVAGCVAFVDLVLTALPQSWTRYKGGISRVMDLLAAYDTKKGKGEA